MIAAAARQCQRFIGHTPGVLRVKHAARMLSTAAGGEATRYKFSELYTTNHLGLPRLPVPDLDATLDRYLESLKPVTEPVALQAHRKLVESFRTNEGPDLQKQLIAADSHQGYPYSYVEKYWDDMYLELRCPLPVHVAPGYGLRSDTLKRGEEMLRLAHFISATFRWQHKSLAGEMEPDLKALGCMSFLNRVLGTARVPKKGRDELRFSPASRHVAVQCGGRTFRVDVLSENGSSIVDVYELQRQLQHIYSQVPPSPFYFSSPSAGNAEPGIGMLTREDRDIWAALRAKLESVSAANRRGFEDVDSALFVVCLDHEAPRSPTQRSQDQLHGRPGNLGNRWYDKMQVGARSSNLNYY